MIARVGFAAVVVAAALSASSTLLRVQAQERPQTLCAPYSQYRDTLADRYGEQPVSTGIVDTQVYTQLFTSPAGTWTIVVVGTDGEACLLAYGDQWDQGPADLRGALR